MDTSRPMGHTSEEEPHRAGLHAGVEGYEDYHEKKPMLTKMKEKMKKIKDTFKKKHHHGSDHNDDSDQGLEEEQEEEDNDDKLDNYTATANDNPSFANQMVTGKLEERRNVEEMPLGDSVGAYPQDPAASNLTTIPREGKEIDSTPVIQSFKAMKVSEQPNSGNQVVTGHLEARRNVGEMPLGDFVATSPQDPAAPNLSTIPREGKEIDTSPVFQSLEAMEVSEPLDSGNKVPEMSESMEKMKPEGKEIDTSPVIQSFEAMEVSEPLDSGNKVPEMSESMEKMKPVSSQGNKSDTYTDKLYSTAKAAAEIVYEKVAEGSAAVKQTMTAKDTGGTGKGTVRPSDDDKALSEVISSATPKTSLPMPVKSSSEQTGGGTGIMGWIKGAVEPLVGGQQKLSPEVVSESKEAEDVTKVDEQQPKVSTH